MERGTAPDTERRGFRIGDAMVLVAAMSLSLFLLRIAASLGLLQNDSSRISVPSLRFLAIVSLGGSCTLVGLSLAVLILTLRQPQRCRRHDIRGPGFVACAVVMAALVLPIASFAVGQLQHGIGEDLDRYYDDLLRELVSCAGMMIIGAWLALVLVGRWRRRPIWTEWLGRVVGACWVLLYVSHQLCYNVVMPLLWWWED